MCNLQSAKDCASVKTSLATVRARAQEMGIPFARQLVYIPSADCGNAHGPCRCRRQCYAWSGLGFGFGSGPVWIVIATNERHQKLRKTPLQKVLRDWIIGKGRLRLELQVGTEKKNRGQKEITCEVGEVYSVRWHPVRSSTGARVERQV